MLGSEGCKYPSWFKVVISLLIMAARESATASVFLDRLSVGFIVIVVDNNVVFSVGDQTKTTDYVHIVVAPSVSLA
jgi:hypothetical protein